MLMVSVQEISHITVQPIKRSLLMLFVFLIFLVTFVSKTLIEYFVSLMYNLFIAFLYDHLMIIKMTNNSELIMFCDNVLSLCLWLVEQNMIVGLMNINVIFMAHLA